MIYLPHKRAFVFLVIVIFWFLNFYSSGIEDGYSLTGCDVEDWNKITTSKFPHRYSRWLWMRTNVSEENTQNNTKLQILNAYVYPYHIAVVLTNQNLFKKSIYCRYYDCHRNEIEKSYSKSEVFPESTVHCPRKVGTKFMSVSEELSTDPTDIVPLTFRAYQRPVHQFTVCTSPIFGKDPKWLQIAEFIEDYKLQGATLVYIYIGQISAYDRKIVSHYERTGYVEVIELEDKYERPFYSWQMIANNDCLHRSKYHSKWTAFVDLDERIQTFGSKTVADYLSNINDSNLGVLQLATQRIAVNESLPEKYENLKHLQENMIFRKFTLAKEITYINTKVIARPEKVEVLATHIALAMNFGVKVANIPQEDLVLRHYRTTKQSPHGGNSYSLDGTFFKSELNPEYADKLKNLVSEVVQKVYDIVPLNCKFVRKEVWKSRNISDPCLLKPNTFSLDDNI